MILKKTTIVSIYWHSGETCLLRFWKHLSSCVSFSDFANIYYIILVEKQCKSHNSFLHLSELRWNHVCNSYLIFWICILYAIAYSVYKCCIIFNNIFFYYLIPYIHVIWYFFCNSKSGPRCWNVDLSIV